MATVRSRGWLVWVDGPAGCGEAAGELSSRDDRPCGSKSIVSVRQPSAVFTLPLPVFIPIAQIVCLPAAGSARDKS